MIDAHAARADRAAAGGKTPGGRLGISRRQARAGRDARARGSRASSREEIGIDHRAAAAAHAPASPLSLRRGAARRLGGAALPRSSRAASTASSCAGATAAALAAAPICCRPIARSWRRCDCPSACGGTLTRYYRVVSVRDLEGAAPAIGGSPRGRALPERRGGRGGRGGGRDFLALRTVLAPAELAAFASAWPCRCSRAAFRSSAHGRWARAGSMPWRDSYRRCAAASRPAASLDLLDRLAMLYLLLPLVIFLAVGSRSGRPSLSSVRGLFARSPSAASLAVPRAHGRRHAPAARRRGRRGLRMDRLRRHRASGFRECRLAPARCGACTISSTGRWPVGYGVARTAATGCCGRRSATTCRRR